MAYRAQGNRERWTAMAASVLVTGVVGAAILTGLNVEIVREVSERLETFDVALPKPPPEEPPPEPEPERRSEQDEGSPPAPKASPIVAPKPVVEVPTTNPVAAAPTAGTGASSSTGQGGAGAGSGAGGAGSGSGSGFGSGSSPVQLVRNLTRGDYRALTAGRLPAGRAMVSLRVEPTGAPSGCQIVRSSGDGLVDRGLCPLIVRRLRFRPARDGQGRPVAVTIQYVATWRL